MKWPELPLDARERISQLQGEALDKAAEALSLKPASLKVYISQFRQQQRLSQTASMEGVAFPPQSQRKWTDFPVVEAENGVIISDIHVPNGDVVWLETVLLMAIQRKLKTLFILGDTQDSNVPGIAAHPSVWQDGSAPTYRSSTQIIRDMLRIFLTWFDDIYIISGNHDEWLSRMTGGQTDIGMFLEGMDDRIHFTNYRKLYIANERGYIACYHQSNFSNNGIALGRKMYAQEAFQGTKPYAVILTHIHHWACGKTEDNLCEVYSLGATEDEQLAQYVNITPSAHAHRSQSMILLEEGYLTNLERRSTNWRKLLGEYADKASICKAAA